MRTRPTRLLAVTVAGGLVLAGLLAPVAAGVALVSNVTPAPATDPLRSTKMPAVTTVLDRDGNPIAQLDEQYRIPVAINAISPSMRGAAVAIEDRRFYDEAGVDPIGTVRALVTNALGDRRRAAPRSRSST